MAITYKISESGLHKIVEILDGEELIGRRKFLSKEVITTINGSLIELKDNFTQEVLFSGNVSSFINSDGDAFGDTASEAVASMNTNLSNVNISVEELKNLEVIGGGISLSNYTTTEELNTYKLEVASSIEGVSNNIVNLSNEVTETFDTVEQYLDTSEKGIAYQFYNDGTRCNPNLSVTFTTGDSGNVEFLVLNIHASLNTAAAIEAVVSTADPGAGVSYNAENSIDNRHFFEDNTEAEGEIYSTETVLIYSPIANTANIGSSGRFQMSLTPNTEYTFYLWARTTLLGVNSNPKLIFNDGLKVKIID